MIIKNPKTMDKIKLKLVLTEDNDPPCAGLRDACNLSRKYRALKIENLSDFHSFMDQKTGGDADNRIAASLSRAEKLHCLCR